MTRVAFALGSNVGDRRAHLTAAAHALCGRLHRAAVSSLYETEPVGDVPQAPYLNAVVVGETGAGPSELADWIRSLEAAAGRIRTQRWGPRTLDVDVLLLGARTLEAAGLRIPHPRFRERAFVLEPLAEVAADWVDPETDLSVAGLLERLAPADRTEVVRVEAPEWAGAVPC